jgi:hypothetical protein
VLSICAIIISIIGPGTIYDYVHHGEIELQKPVGYAILNKTYENIRTHEKNSDYSVILPIDWINPYKNTKMVVNNIHLILSNDNKSDILNFEGEYPSISNKSLSEDYVIEHSIILDPNSVSGKNLVFKFSNPNSYLNTAQNYSAKVGFQARQAGNIQINEYYEVPLFNLSKIDYSPRLRKVSNGYWYYRDI